MKKIKTMWKITIMVIIVGLVATMLPLSTLASQVLAGAPQKVVAKAEQQEVTFPDQNLEAAIREMIAKPEGPIYTTDLEKLTELDANVKGVANLTGLEYCTNLIVLYLQGDQISDISSLSNLANLATPPGR